MQRVRPPLNLRLLVGNLTDTLLAALATNVSAQHQLMAMTTLTLFYPWFEGWDHVIKYSGNCMCELSVGFADQVGLFCTSDGRCASEGVKQLQPSIFVSLTALLATDPHIFVGHFCRMLWPCSTMSCRSTLATLQSCQSMAADVRDSLRTTLAIQFMQYVWSPSFDTMATYGVAVHLGLVQGRREVITFEQTMLLSGALYYAVILADPPGIPLNVASYVRYAIQYMTFVLLCVALLVCLSIVTTRGHMDGRNMLEFNCVADLVWPSSPCAGLPPAHSSPRRRSCSRGDVVTEFDHVRPA
ncbi:Aste57867_8704 [Aphanomyces stellatus]|uniref:Aste57867_8704 protein n=1 Tax=Aphanomyces stellatus TaxID=120398 RepID=A0A485KKY6_9STRA|nr:hypothetical protein As57867_008670 [Aphanomyces stellatus]VFT85590.1 Aste57867_8704 [Aphanomyces stellatus]